MKLPQDCFAVAQGGSHVKADEWGQIPGRQHPGPGLSVVRGLQK